MVVDLAGVGIGVGEARKLFHPPERAAAFGDGRRVGVDAFDHLVLPDLFDQLLVDRIALADDLALVADAIEVLQQHDRVGRVAGAENGVRCEAHHLVDLGAIGRLLVVIDQAAVRPADFLGDAFHDLDARLGERRLRHEGPDLPGAQRHQEVSGAGDLQHGVGLGAHEIALVRQQGDRVGARHGAKEGLVLPAQRRHGRRYRRGPGAQDRGHLVDVDQLACRAHAGIGIGLVVLAHEHDLAAKHATRGIHFLDDGGGDLGHRRTVGAARARERRQGRDLDGVGLRPQDRWCGDGSDTAQQRGTTSNTIIDHDFHPIPLKRYRPA